MAGDSRRNKTVGLDKPCRVCGKPVHYSYSGPVEGVCGRCSDTRKNRRRTRGYHRATVVSRERGQRSTASVVVMVCAVCLVGAAAVAVALRFLLG